MADFPTLTAKPLGSGWNEGKAIDPTIRSPKEAGYVQTRAEFTRIPRKYHLSYKMNATDVGLLQAHEDGQGIGADSFNWTHPVSSTVKVVRSHLRCHAERGLSFAKAKLNRSRSIPTLTASLEAESAMIVLRYPKCDLVAQSWRRPHDAF